MYVNSGMFLESFNAIWMKNHEFVFQSQISRGNQLCLPLAGNSCEPHGKCLFT